MQQVKQVNRFFPFLLWALLSLQRQNAVNASLDIEIMENYKDKRVIKNLKAKDMGLLHNTLMYRVHESVLVNRPKTFEDFDNIVYDEVSVLCDDDDGGGFGFCKKDIVRDEIKKNNLQVLEQFRQGRSFDGTSDFPRNLPKNLREYFTRIYDATAILESNEVDSLEMYKQALEQISNEVEESKTLSERHKFAIQALASIADGSGTFWKQVETGEDSILRELSLLENQDHPDRQLQIIPAFNFTFDIVEVTISDILGAIRRTFPNPVAVIMFAINPVSWATLVPDLVIGSILGSLAAMGMVIFIPKIPDLIMCGITEIIPGAPVPCTTQTLFGPFLGQLLNNLFPFWTG